jgi:hypothetical protein
MSFPCSTVRLAEETTEFSVSHNQVDFQVSTDIQTICIILDLLLKMTMLYASFIGMESAVGTEGCFVPLHNYSVFKLSLQEFITWRHSFGSCWTIRPFMGVSTLLQYAKLPSWERNEKNILIIAKQSELSPCFWKIPTYKSKSQKIKLIFDKFRSQTSSLKSTWDT